MRLFRTVQWEQKYVSLAPRYLHTPSLNGTSVSVSAFGCYCIAVLNNQFVSVLRVKFFMNNLLGTCRNPIYESEEIFQNMFSCGYELISATICLVLGDLCFCVNGSNAVWTCTGLKWSVFSSTSYFPSEKDVGTLLPALWWCWAHHSQKASLLLLCSIK